VEHIKVPTLSLISESELEHTASGAPCSDTLRLRCMSKGGTLSRESLLLFSRVTKQAALMRRSTVPSLPLPWTNTAYYDTASVTKKRKSSSSMDTLLLQSEIHGLKWDLTLPCLPVWVMMSSIGPPIRWVTSQVGTRTRWVTSFRKVERGWPGGGVSTWPACLRTKPGM
jgi:hypothetical protein